MFVIGVTGGIGCGKTTVADIFRARNVPVLDADEISHAVTKAGGPAISKIIDTFGAEYILPDGSMNREKMAELVFSDSRSLDQLSLIIHREVFNVMAREKARLAQQKTKCIVLDVPVPAKEGFIDQCDQIWLVWADLNVRLERLAHRGMSREEAQRRIDIQLSREEYEDISDLVIENNGSIRELEAKINELIYQELLPRGIAITEGYPYSDSLSTNLE